MEPDAQVTLKVSQCPSSTLRERKKEFNGWFLERTCKCTNLIITCRASFGGVWEGNWKLATLIGAWYMLYYDHKMLYNSKGGLNCMAINLLTFIQVAYIICTCVASML